MVNKFNVSQENTAQQLQVNPKEYYDVGVPLMENHTIIEIGIYLAALALVNKICHLLSQYKIFGVLFVMAKISY